MDKLTKRVRALAKQLEHMVGGDPTPPRPGHTGREEGPVPAKPAATRASA